MQDESCHSCRIESKTSKFATLPDVNSLLAVFFLSLSQIDFPWVDSTLCKTNRQHLLPSLVKIAFMLYFFLSLSQVDFWWVNSTLRKTNRAIRVKSSTFVTLPGVNSLLAVFFSLAKRLLVSRFDFMQDESCHSCCIFFSRKTTSGESIRLYARRIVPFMSNRVENVQICYPPRC